MANDGTTAKGTEAEGVRDAHRWSGWPGAYCLDCFVFDQTEQCLADGCLDFIENPDDPEHPIIKECTEHEQLPCTKRPVPPMDQRTRRKPRATIPTEG